MASLLGECQNPEWDRYHQDNTDTRLHTLFNVKSYVDKLLTRQNPQTLENVFIPHLKVLLRPVLDVFSGVAASAVNPSDTLLPAYGRDEELAEILDTHVVASGLYHTREAVAAAYDFEATIDILRLVTDSSIDMDNPHLRSNSKSLRQWNSLSMTSSAIDSSATTPPIPATLISDLQMFFIADLLHRHGGKTPAQKEFMNAANITMHLSAAHAIFGIKPEWRGIRLQDEEHQIEDVFEFPSWASTLSRLSENDIRKLSKKVKKGIDFTGASLGLSRVKNPAYSLPKNFGFDPVR
jgi:hypothetical protein